MEKGFPMRPSAKFQPSVFVSLVIVLVLGFGLLLAAGFTVVSAQSSSGSGFPWWGRRKTAPEVKLLQADENAITLQAAASGVEVKQVTIAGQTYPCKPGRRRLRARWRNRRASPACGFCRGGSAGWG